MIVTSFLGREDMSVLIAEEETPAKRLLVKVHQSIHKKAELRIGTYLV